MIEKLIAQNNVSNFNIVFPSVRLFLNYCFVNPFLTVVIIKRRDLTSRLIGKSIFESSLSRSQFLTYTVGVLLIWIRARFRSQLIHYRILRGLIEEGNEEGSRKKREEGLLKDEGLVSAFSRFSTLVLLSSSRFRTLLSHCIVIRLW